MDYDHESPQHWQRVPGPGDTWVRYARDEPGAEPVLVASEATNLDRALEAAEQHWGAPFWSAGTWREADPERDECPGRGRFWCVSVQATE